MSDYDMLLLRVEHQDAEIERLRAEYPYSELDMDMHVEAVTKELRARIERLEAELKWISTGGDLWSRQVALAALARKEG